MRDDVSAPGDPDHRVLISAYACSPAYGSWDPGFEGALLPALFGLPGVAGFEVPWLGKIHPHDDAWFLNNVPAGAQLAITALPYVMRRCAADPHYGIASTDGAGRAEALSDLRRLAGDVQVLAAHGAKVAVVALHTAPAVMADADALAESLAEVADLHWGDAQLVIEHCDAAMPGRPHEKGFLPVADEIAALTGVDPSIGMWLNWGRSAIELRDAGAVATQIADVADTGRLTGLTFSGASAVDGLYGTAWTDVHLPLLSADPRSRSLLDDRQVRVSLSAAGDVPWMGLKVSRRPEDHSVADIVRSVGCNLDLIAKAHATCNETA
jgi:hypothetical protein